NLAQMIEIAGAGLGLYGLIFALFGPADPTRHPVPKGLGPLIGLLLFLAGLLLAVVGVGMELCIPLGVRLGDPPGHPALGLLFGSLLLFGYAVLVGTFLQRGQRK